MSLPFSNIFYGLFPRWRSEINPTNLFHISIRCGRLMDPLYLFSSTALDHFHINRGAERGSSAVYAVRGRIMSQYQKKDSLPSCYMLLLILGKLVTAQSSNLTLIPRVLWTLPLPLICLKKCCCFNFNSMKEQWEKGHVRRCDVEFTGNSTVWRPEGQMLSHSSLCLRVFYPRLSVIGRWLLGSRPDTYSDVISIPDWQTQTHTEKY